MQVRGPVVRNSLTKGLARWGNLRLSEARTAWTSSAHRRPTASAYHASAPLDCLLCLSLPQALAAWKDRYAWSN